MLDEGRGWASDFPITGLRQKATAGTGPAVHRRIITRPTAMKS